MHGGGIQPIKFHTIIANLTPSTFILLQQRLRVDKIPQDFDWRLRLEFTVVSNARRADQ